VECENTATEALKSSRKHHDAKDSVHQGQSAILQGQLLAAMKDSKQFGMGRPQARTLDEARGKSEKLAQDIGSQAAGSLASASAAPMTPQSAVDAGDAAASPGSQSASPFAYLKKKLGKKPKGKAKSKAVVNKCVSKPGGKASASTKAKGTSATAVDSSLSAKQAELRADVDERYETLANSFDEVKQRFSSGSLDKQLMNTLCSNLAKCKGFYSKAKHLDIRKLERLNEISPSLEAMKKFADVVSKKAATQEDYKQVALLCHNETLAIPPAYAKKGCKSIWDANMEEQNYVGSLESLCSSGIQPHEVADIVESTMVQAMAKCKPNRDPKGKDVVQLVDLVKGLVGAERALQIEAADDPLVQDVKKHLKGTVDQFRMMLPIFECGLQQAPTISILDKSTKASH
jgi:hypothetical protein